MTIDFNGVRARHSLVETVARYVDIRKRGNEYEGLCPFHNDGNPSFKIYRGRDGFEHYRCFSCGAGAEGGDVIDFLVAIENIAPGEAVRRLDGEELPLPNTRPPRTLPPDEVDCWEPIIPVPDSAPKYDPAHTFNPRRPTMDDGTVRFVNYRPTLLTPYRNAADELIGYIVRMEFADGQKICPVITYCIGPGGTKRWCAKRPKPPYPLVGVEQLAKWPDKPVLLVEGEKKRDTAERALPAFVVLSLLGGAEAVKVNDLKPLLGRKVVLCPDADVPGRKAMREVGSALK